MQVKESAIKQLSLIEDLLNQIPTNRYSNELDLLSGSSVGQHVRHILELYECLLDQQESGTVNYDKRVRNAVIENDPGHANTVLRSIIRRLTELPENKDIILEAALDSNSEHSDKVKSTIARELVYNIEHSIHHMAIIKIAVKARDPQISLPEEFGVAPSTIRHMKSQSS